MKAFVRSEGDRGWIIDYQYIISPLSIRATCLASLSTSLVTSLLLSVTMTGQMHMGFNLTSAEEQIHVDLSKADDEVGEDKKEGCR